MPNKRKLSKLFTNALAKGKLADLPQVKEAMKMMNEKRARDTEDIDFNFDESKVRGFDKLTGEDAQDKRMRKSMFSEGKKRKSQAEIDAVSKRDAKRQKKAANQAATQKKDQGAVIVPKSSKKNKYFFLAHPDKLEKHKTEEIQAISTSTNFVMDKEKIELAAIKKKKSLMKQNGNKKGAEMETKCESAKKPSKDDEKTVENKRPKITSADYKNTPVLDFSELGKTKFKFKTVMEEGPDGTMISVTKFAGDDDGDDDKSNANDKGSEDEAVEQSDSEDGEEGSQDNEESKEDDQTNKKKEKTGVVSKMVDKLQASRFRDTDAFKAYHEGFRQQVNKWPMNPIDVIIKKIQAKSSNLIIADFGCGEAKLAASVKNKVHSFDLVAVNDLVTKCDMKKVPLNSESIDIAVFSLSLMGTNVIEFLIEAHRVLKQKGILKIAEVVSRIEDRYVFIRKVESIGFKLVINKEEEEKEKKAEYFYFFDFVKNSPIVKGKPNIQLSACLYKKR